jgi:hypothetical protein
MHRENLRAQQGQVPGSRASVRAFGEPTTARSLDAVLDD